MKKLISFLSIAVIAIAMVGCGGSTATPSGTVDAYYTALEKGDFEKAVSYIKVSDEGDIPVLVGKLEGMSQKGYVVKSHKILSETIAEDGENATGEVEEVIIEEAGAEATTQTSTTKVTKVDGQWLVLLF